MHVSAAVAGRRRRRHSIPGTGGRTAAIFLIPFFVIFAIAMIVRQLYAACQAVWGKAADDFDHTKASSGI